MTGADEPAVRYEVSGRIARITLNRPGSRNALSAEVIAALLAAFDRVRADDAARAVVLTGAGQNVFCAGGDLGNLARMGTAGAAAGGAAAGGPAGGGRAAGGPDAEGAAAAGGQAAGSPDAEGAAAGGPEAAEYDSEPLRLFAAFRDIGKPIIARVAGHALGGGLGLAVSCDIAIAAADVKLGTPEINVGLWPMMIMAVLNRNIPPKQAFKLYYTGQLISAVEGVGLGLLTEAVPRADLDRRVDELATLIAGKSPAALRLGRAAFFEVEGQPLRDQLTYLLDQLAVLAATDEAREGIAAFLEKRPPRFFGN